MVIGPGSISSEPPCILLLSFSDVVSMTLSISFSGATITVEDTGDVAGAVAVTGDTGAATGVTPGNTRGAA